MEGEFSINSSKEVYTVGFWSVKAGNENTFIDAWEAFAKWTIKNYRSAIEGFLLNNLEQPQRFISFEPWLDTESIQEWRQSPEFKAFIAKAKELCDEIQPGTWKSVVHVGGS